MKPMVDKLKEEFNKKFGWLFKDPCNENLCDKDKKHIWNWITQNYIPREDVEGLKMDKLGDKVGEFNYNYFAGYNKAVDEINQRITNLLKK